MQSLAGKRVVVSGGTTGIGLAIAKHLCDLNAKVLVFGRDQGDLDEALGQLPCAVGLTADVGHADDVRRVFAMVDDHLGGLDALVNNAGVGGSSVTALPEEKWHEVLHTDLLGAMHMAQEAVPRMRAVGGGTIVNVGSMSAKTRDEEADVYVAAKSGLRGWSDSFGRTVAKFDINVSLIEPGKVLSDLSKDDPDVDEKLAKDEMIYADDIARMVIYILSQPKSVSIPMVQVRPRMQLI